MFCRIAVWGLQSLWGCSGRIRLFGVGERIALQGREGSFSIFQKFFANVCRVLFGGWGKRWAIILSGLEIFLILVFSGLETCKRTVTYQFISNNQVPFHLW